MPDFNNIKISEYRPAFEEAMKMHNQEISEIVRNRALPDFDNTIAALDNSGKLLSQISRVFFGLNSANTTPEMQALSRELNPISSKHPDDITLHPLLFQKVKSVDDNQAMSNLNPEPTKLPDFTYKGLTGERPILR